MALSGNAEVENTVKIVVFRPQGPHGEPIKVRFGVKEYQM